jgi:hypothetical protein
VLSGVIIAKRLMTSVHGCRNQAGCACSETSIQQQQHPWVLAVFGFEQAYRLWTSTVQALRLCTVHVMCSCMSAVHVHLCATGHLSLSVVGRDWPGCTSGWLVVPADHEDAG